MVDAQRAMKTPLRRRLYLPQLVVGIAVILFSTAGITAIMGWRSSTGGPDDGIAPHDSAAPSAKALALAVHTAQKRAMARARVLGKCAECGLIESIGGINGSSDDSDAGATGKLPAGDRDGQPLNSTAHYEIIVRMADGSRRMINSASPARWRLGERVIVIAGSIPHR